MKNKKIYVLVTDYENEQYEVVGAFEDKKEAVKKAKALVAQLIKHWNSRGNGDNAVDYEQNENYSEDGDYFATYQVNDDYITINQVGLLKQ